MNFNNLSSFVMRYDNVGFMNRGRAQRGSFGACEKKLLKESFFFFFVPTRKTAIFQAREKRETHTRAIKMCVAVVVVVVENNTEDTGTGTYSVTMENKEIK